METCGCWITALSIAIVSVIGLLVVVDEWNQRQWTRKVANSLGIGLWGCFVLMLTARYRYQQVEAQQQPKHFLCFLGLLRNFSWLSLVLSLLTGTLLAYGSASFCGQAWILYSSFYHIAGFLGVAGSLTVWFALPGLVRSKLIEMDVATAGNKHLRSIRTWAIIVLSPS